MIKYPQSILNLIDSFSLLPGIGKKTAERYAFYILDNLSEEDVLEFAHNLEQVKQNIKHCSICGNLTDNDVCPICSDSNRDISKIMVVEQERDVLSIEKLAEFNGLYHVLGGAIAFSKGIGPKDLNIDSLIKRIKENKVEEIILATNATLEGETTARYIKEVLVDFPNLKITRIAYGLPVGQDLIYADQMTLLKALEGRTEYK